MKKTMIKRALIIILVITLIFGIMYCIYYRKNAYCVVRLDYNNSTESKEIKVKKGDILENIGEPSNPGYTFVEWQLDGKPYDFTAKVTSNITLKAVWKGNPVSVMRYLVAFDSDGGNDIVYQLIESGKMVAIPAIPTKIGYTFVEWQLDGKPYDFTTKVTSNITLKAVWEEKSASAPISYIVTFDSDGGSPVAKQTIESGKNVTRPANPTKIGYTFVEWQLDGKPYDFTTQVNSNIALKAVWKKNISSTSINYTVTFDSDGGSPVAKQIIESGKNVTRPANPTKAGYTFVEWQLNGNTYNFSMQVTSNIILKAVWEENKVYKVKKEIIDAYSPDYKLSVYENGVFISFISIEFMDGTVICTSSAPYVSKIDIDGVNMVKIVLHNGKVVNANVE